MQLCFTVLVYAGNCVSNLGRRALPTQNPDLGDVCPDCSVYFDLIKRMNVMFTDLCIDTNVRATILVPAAGRNPGMGTPLEHFNIVTEILPTDNIVGSVEKILTTVRPYQDVFFCLVHGFIALHPSSYSEYEGRSQHRSVLHSFHRTLRKREEYEAPSTDIDPLRALHVFFYSYPVTCAH